MKTKMKNKRLTTRSLAAIVEILFEYYCEYIDTGYTATTPLNRELIQDLLVNLIWEFPEFEKQIDLLREFLVEYKPNTSFQDRFPSLKVK